MCYFYNQEDFFSLFTDGKYSATLWPIHGYLVPSAKSYKKRNGKSTTKYAIKGTQESFLFCAKTQQEMEEHTKHLKMKKKTPYSVSFCVLGMISQKLKIYVCILMMYDINFPHN